ncbi:MAG TPA: FecR domain-containing protein [Verrucomicrobiae bacterium]|nr:FecR domain-containing protein [Verrucomicrobiae bacterium]
MRKIKPFIVGVVGCLLALATVNNVSAQATDGSAKVVAVSGDARYFTAGDPTPHPIKVGMTVKPGMTIQTATGARNYVDLMLNNAHAQEAPAASPSEIAHYTPKAEQDGIRIYENSVLVVDKLTVTQTGADTVTDTELDLKAGKILGTVKKLSPTSKYEVKIPNGVAGIRGTIYVLSANGILSVLTGSVVVAYVGPDGNVITQVVNSGQQFDLNTGLITQISSSEIGPIIRDAIIFRTFFVNTPTTYVAPDHRIYFVSTGKGNAQANPNPGNPGNGGGDGP